MLDSLRSPIQKVPSSRIALFTIAALGALVLLFAAFNQGPTSSQAIGLASESFFVLAMLTFAGSQYAFQNLTLFAGQTFTPAHEFGLLILIIAGGILWVFSASGDRRTTLQLHSTQTVSGLLFIGMALLMLNGTLAEFNALIPPDLAIWFSGFEDKLVGLYK